MQVSFISIANCLGWIISGIGADLVKNRLSLPRTYCICAVAALFDLLQVVATRIEDMQHLWRAPVLLELACRSVFALFLTVVIEWFGLAHSLENRGLVSLSPMMGGIWA